MATGNVSLPALPSESCTIIHISSRTTQSQRTLHMPIHNTFLSRACGLTARKLDHFLMQDGTCVTIVCFTV